MIRIIHSARGKETLFEHAGSQAFIGRPKPGTLCDIDLSPDIEVSRPHARVSLETGQFWIEDLNSKHGTRLNGQEIKGHGKKEWRLGDKVQIGETTLRLEPVPEGSARVEAAPRPKDWPLLASTETRRAGSNVNIGPSLDANSQFMQDSKSGASEGERLIALLYELPLRFARESRLDGLLQIIVERLVEVIPGATRGALLLAEPESGALVLQSHLPEGQPAVSMTLAERAVSRREGFIWNRGEEEATGSMLMNGIGTGMYAPLIWREKVLGVICVDNPNREKGFAREDLRLLLGVAHYAAMSVAHQRTLDELVRHSELTHRLFSNRFAPHLRHNLMRAAANGSLHIGTRQSHITVLISDIRGFTQLTARLGAQRTGDLLNEYFPPLVDAILAHNGAIEQFIGDAIFGVFGTPEPDNQQHENAVRAALAMQAASAAVMQSRLARGAETCEIGIGIHCGEALHGFIGNAERLQFSVIGAPANLASRYCGAAAKGEILLSPEVYARVFNKFKSERIEIETKHEGSLVAYRVQGSPALPVR
jgi:adenylate cyclase